MESVLREEESQRWDGFVKQLVLGQGERVRELWMVRVVKFLRRSNNVALHGDTDRSKPTLTVFANTAREHG